MAVEASSAADVPALEPECEALFVELLCDSDASSDSSAGVPEDELTDEALVEVVPEAIEPQKMVWVHKVSGTIHIVRHRNLLDYTQASLAPGIEGTMCKLCFPGEASPDASEVAA